MSDMISIDIEKRLAALEGENRALRSKIVELETYGVRKKIPEPAQPLERGAQVLYNPPEASAFVMPSDEQLKRLAAIVTGKVAWLGDVSGPGFHGDQEQRIEDWWNQFKAAFMALGRFNLHFLLVGGSGDFHERAFELKSGFLKGDFSEAVGAQLQAVALATVKPATKESGKYLVEILRPVAGRLEQLIRFPPSGLSAGQLADIHFALGLALTTIGEQAGDNIALTEAVAAYREALKEYTRARSAPMGGDADEFRQCAL